MFMYMYTYRECVHIMFAMFLKATLFFFVSSKQFVFFALMGVQNIHDSFTEYNMHVIKHSFVQSILYLNRAEHLISVEAHRY